MPSLSARLSTYIITSPISSLTRRRSPEDRAEALGDVLDEAVSIGDLPPAAVRLALQRAGVRVVVEEGKVVRIE